VDDPSGCGECSEERYFGGVCFAIARLNIWQMTGPSRSAAAPPKPMMRRVKMSITTMIQQLFSKIDSQRKKSTLHKLSFAAR
jgi:hypothetical protein